MNNTAENYTSKLGQYMSAYLEQQLNLGYKAEDIRFTLRTIDYYLNTINFKGTYITKTVYVNWFDTIKDQKATTIYKKVSVFIRFLKYMSGLGIECYIPILPRKHDSGFVPYIYSQQEIERIFQACDDIRMKERHANSILIIIPTLIRLLYSTAIRISEALSIKNKDIHFDRSIIVLNQTKNGSQRLAPINKSLENVLKQYIEYRNKIPIDGIYDPDSNLFVSSIGKPCSRKTVLSYFHKILKEAGISYRGNHEGPRVHDIRHTACVHSLVKMTRAGKDIYCCLPMISVFMGHKKVLNTEYYLRLTQEMYPELIQLDSSVTASINEVIKRSFLINNNGII